MISLSDEFELCRSDITGCSPSQGGGSWAVRALPMRERRSVAHVRDEGGKVMTVRYEAVNAMLLNEFLKEHRKVEEQQAAITQLKNEFQTTVAQQQKQIETLTATVQKVSDQLELNKPAPQLVANDH